MTVQEAEITAADEPQEVQVSTNELVFMIGESVVRDRQNLKRLQFVDKQIGIARDEALKARSLALGAEEKNLALERVKASLDARISDLEKQLNEIAQERDMFRNKVRLLEQKKQNRVLKRGKQTANTTGD